MATKKNQKKKKKELQLFQSKEMSYEQAVKYMEEDANNNLLPKFKH